MDKTDIIKIAICLAYYHIGGLATTNIERLCKGCEMSVLDSKCYCPNCKKKINWFLQLPIISYIICKGRCTGCSSKIPVNSLFLEITVFTVMTVISALNNFSPLGVLLSFVGYELIRVIYIAINGKREKKFIKEYITAVLLISVFFLMIEFMALLLQYSKP